MTIAIIGNDVSFKEAQMKLGHGHSFIHADEMAINLNSQQFNVVFDFNSEWDDKTATAYLTTTAPVFLNTIFTTLSGIPIKTKGPCFGFCGLTTFFNRSQLEVVSSDAHKAELDQIMKSIGCDYAIVKDQVGMVTPRVVCMIINEAYEAWQQGVASREDIDLSMKLGTNYPFGPFEWAERIGLENVRSLLLACKKAFNDPRFNPNF